MLAAHPLHTTLSTFVIRHGNTGIVVLKDFSKAFDLDNHNIAIEKNDSLGVRRAADPWVCSFLNKRCQCNNGGGTNIMLSRDIGCVVIEDGE